MEVKFQFRFVAYSKMSKIELEELQSLYYYLYQFLQHQLTLIEKELKPTPRRGKYKRLLNDLKSIDDMLNEDTDRN